MKKLGLVIACLGAALLQAATTYKVEAKYPVAGDGSFDYLTVDSAARRLYISHGTQVDVVEADSGKIIRTTGDTPGAHGIANAPQFNRGFTTKARQNKVSIFDPATQKCIN